jgi:hypothetical protein
MAKELDVSCRARFGGRPESEWDVYIASLRKGHIQISDEINSLAWSKNKVRGEYTAKLGCIELIDTIPVVPAWWYKQVWKVKVPKAKVFMWLALMCLSAYLGSASEEKQTRAGIMLSLQKK